MAVSARIPILTGLQPRRRSRVRLLGREASAAAVRLLWRLALGLVAALVASAWALAPAAAQDQPSTVIEVTGGSIRPIPIAIPYFTGADAELGRQVADVIADDLRRSGLFDVLNRLSFSQTDLGAGAVPTFPSWSSIGAEALIAGTVTIGADGRPSFSFRLWDPVTGTELVSRVFVTTQQNFRRAAHLIADLVYQRLTGNPGYFDTRVVFVEESGPRGDRIRRLAVMDQDGHNVQYLTDGSYLVLTPRFSPTSQEITYIAYDPDPRVYIYDLNTGNSELVTTSTDMTFSARFSPDGRFIALSVQEGGNANIYLVDLITRAQTRLTAAASIDTSPSFSPDMGEIAFESDRAGSQQIYVMNANGTGVRRISFGEGSYGTPVWSPTGEYIAFTRQIGGEFQIGIMRPDGTGERILSRSTAVQEGPTWAPNGQVIMFFRDPGGTGGAQLFTVNINGFNEQLIPTPGWASDPAWSPPVG